MLIHSSPISESKFAYISFQCFWIAYMDEIASEIGAKPNFINLFKKDPFLALRCFFGPCVPAQYRLVGPGKWSGAKATIETSVQRCLAPMRTRILPKNFDTIKTNRFTISLPTSCTPVLVVMLAFFLFLCACIY